MARVTQRQRRDRGLRYAMLRPDMALHWCLHCSLLLLLLAEPSAHGRLDVCSCDPDRVAPAHLLPLPRQTGADAAPQARVYGTLMLRPPLLCS